MTPAPYARCSRRGREPGYVVAAPIFPLGNANAPGRSERVGHRQPAARHELRDHAHAPARRDAAQLLPGLIAPHEIAVAGQSDGGETALAVAYDRHFLDRRVHAAVILSGAEIPGVGGFDFPAPSPPLLAARARPTRSTSRGSPTRSSTPRRARSSCSRCSARSICRRTRPRSRSSGSSSG